MIKDEVIEKAGTNNSIKENQNTVQNSRQSFIPRHEILIKQKSRNEQVTTIPVDREINPVFNPNGYHRPKNKFEHNEIENGKQKDTSKSDEDMLEDLKNAQDESKNVVRKDKLFKGAVVTAMVSTSLSSISSSSSQESKTRKISTCRKDSKAGFPTSKIPAPRF